MLTQYFLSDCEVIYARGLSISSKMIKIKCQTTESYSNCTKFLKKNRIYTIVLLKLCLNFLDCFLESLNDVYLSDKKEILPLSAKDSRFGEVGKYVIKFINQRNNVSHTMYKNGYSFT